MWCVDCQQDVPAVARSTDEPLSCPRCHRELAPLAAATPSDAGIALDSFDEPADDPLAPPVTWLTEEQTQQRLREIDRKLSRVYRRDLPGSVIAGLHHPRTNVPPAEFVSTDIPLRSLSRNIARKPTDASKPTKTSWLLSLTLVAGAISFCVGVGILIWSSAFGLPAFWQAGLTLTVGSEGLLILSLAWMAVRLWRNGRQVNRQLHGVDRQLAEIEQATSELAGSQLTSSQHFYHHYGQVASPHMLMANLQGQVDLMSARLASDRS